MAVGPPLHGAGQQAVAEPVGGRGEALGSPGVHVGVVAVVVAVSVEHQVVLVQGGLPHHQRQELVEGDVLKEGDVDVPRLLEDRLVAPVGVEGGELGGDVVVVPDHDGVQHGQHGLLVDPGVSSLETENLLAGPDTALVWVLQGERQQVLDWRL